MMKRIATVLATTALATAGAFGATPAHAAATCTPVVTVGVTATPYVLGIPHDIADVAVATVFCTDLSLGGHTATLSIEWYYDGNPMPACPSSQLPITVLQGSSVLAAADVATCQRPSSSPATVAHRTVAATLTLDGVAYPSPAVPVILT